MTRTERLLRALFPWTMDEVDVRAREAGWRSGYHIGYAAGQRDAAKGVDTTEGDD